MAELPTLEEIERAILDIFSTLNVRADENLMPQILHAHWVKKPEFRSDDLISGLNSLVQKEHLVENETSYTLTEKGFKAI